MGAGEGRKLGSAAALKVGMECRGGDGVGAGAGAGVDASADGFDGMKKILLPGKSGRGGCEVVGVIPCACNCKGVGEDIDDPAAAAGAEKRLPGSSLSSVSASALASSCVGSPDSLLFLRAFNAFSLRFSSSRPNADSVLYSALRTACAAASLPCACSRFL